MGGGAARFGPRTRRPRRGAQALLLGAAIANSPAGAEMPREPSPKDSAAASQQPGPPGPFQPAFRWDARPRGSGPGTLSPGKSKSHRGKPERKHSQQCAGQRGARPVPPLATGRTSVRLSPVQRHQQSRPHPPREASDKISPDRHRQGQPSLHFGSACGHALAGTRDSHPPRTTGKARHNHPPSPTKGRPAPYPGPLCAVRPRGQKPRYSLLHTPRLFAEFLTLSEDGC